jgi:hypothetical protein
MGAYLKPTPTTVDMVNNIELHIKAVLSNVVRNVDEFIAVELNVATDERERMSQTSDRDESLVPGGSMNGLFTA